MSRILVVQPYKILQHAIASALFPEHAVQTMEKFPEADPSSRADLVIIDAGALRERGLLAAGDVRAMQSWQIPVIWIDADASVEEGLAPNRLFLTPRMKRDELRSAVTEGLRSSLEPPADKPAARVSKSPSAKKTTADPKPDSSIADTDKNIIELVEVIEEMPGDPGRGVEAGNED